MGAPLNAPPTRPSFLRNSAMIFAFQSVVAVTSVAPLLEPSISCNAQRTLVLPVVVMTLVSAWQGWAHAAARSGPPRQPSCGRILDGAGGSTVARGAGRRAFLAVQLGGSLWSDRKSTRLNSSHAT